MAIAICNGIIYKVSLERKSECLELLTFSRVVFNRKGITDLLDE